MCSGCGIISLLWHDAGHRGPCTALELDPDASALCVQAGGRNGIDHITPVQGDLRISFCAAGPEQGKYDFAACNPPYFTAGPQSPTGAGRRPPYCDLHHRGSGPVRPPRSADGGRFVLCQRPDQLVEVLCALRAARLEPKRLAFVASAPAARPGCFLVEPKKGRKPGLKLEPDILIESGVARYGK